MNKDSRVKDKLTGEIIDKSLSLSVKPRGKSRFIYFKNKENMETYLISLYIKDSDMHYWNTMNDLIVEILKPNKDETVPVKVWKYFNDLRKLIDSRFSVYCLQSSKQQMIQFRNSKLNPDLSFRSNYLLKYVKENILIFTNNYTKVFTAERDLSKIYNGVVVNVPSKQVKNNLIERYINNGL